MMLSSNDKENSTNGRPSLSQQKPRGLKQAIEPKHAGTTLNHAAKKTVASKTPFSVSKLTLNKSLPAGSSACASSSGEGTVAGQMKRNNNSNESNKDNKGTERKNQAADAKAAAMARPPAGSKKALSLAKPKAAEAKQKAAAAVAAMDCAMPPVHAMFDDSWREKQEETFTRWINFLFQEEVEQAQAEAQESSYMALERRRRDDRARWRVASVMEDHETRQALYKLDKEVKEGRLAMRKDRMVHTDVGMRDFLLQILLSVRSPCLRPVLECIYHEAIPRTSPDDTVNLHRFLTTRLTKNPDLLSKFAINGACSELNTSQGFYAELNRFILHKFLQTVQLLERGKLQGAFDGCVFSKAETALTPHGKIKLLNLKSTRDMVVRFSKEFLSGEGDVIRHLGLLGMTLNLTQTPLDDFDMTVRVLAADMRDGVRLTQLVERAMPSCDGALKAKLRVPAISRLQKVHNVKVAVEKLKEMGLVDGSKDVARDIVDGNREETLGVLWLLMSNYQLPTVISTQTLKEEAARTILANSRARKDAPLALSRAPIPATLGENTASLLLQWSQAVCAGYGHAVHNFTSSMADGKALCLLISHYLPSVLPLDAIQNTRADAIGSTATSDVADADIAERHGTFAYAAMDRGGEAFASAIAGEKENLRLVSDKAEEIGGIPCVIKMMDMVNAIPEEKTIITFVAYLAARLIELGKDSRAVVLVQRNWRCVRMLRQARKYEGTVRVLQRYSRGYLARRACAMRRRAVLSVQSMRRMAVCAREYARARSRVLKVQSLWRMQAGMREAADVRMTKAVLQSVLSAAHERRERVLRRHAAATTIEAAWRGASLRKRMQRGIRSVVALQARFRSYKARLFVRGMGAARTIQRVYKGYRQLGAFRRAVACIVSIQSTFRGFSVRCKMAAQAEAAFKVQTWWRCVGAVKRLAVAKARVLKVQSLWRMQAGMREAADVRMTKAVLQSVLSAAHERRERVLRRHAAATTMRAEWLRFRERRTYATLKHSVVMAQSIFRGNKARAWCLKLSAAVKIQACYRGWQQRLAFNKTKQKIIFAQSMARGWIARINLARQQGSALKVQTRFRCFVQARRYASIRQSLTFLQARWRGFLAVQRFQGMRRAAVAIQKTYKAHRDCASFRHTKAAAVRVQAFIRSCAASRAYLKTRTRLVSLQATWRGRMQRLEYTKACSSIAMLQRLGRGLLVRQQIRTQAAACVKVQTCFRCHSQTRRYAAARQSLIALQAQWRTFRAARAFKNLRGAATTMGKVWRGRQARLMFRAERAATAIQRVYKGYRQLGAFRRAVACIVSIQSTFRGFSVRCKMAAQAEAAFKVQTWWRCVGAVKRLAVAKARVLKVQSLWRMQAGMREAADVRMTKAVLQSVLSAAHERRERVLRRHAAATTIEAAWRGFVQRKLIDKMHKSAVMVQCLFRGTQARLLCGRIRACIAIQKSYKGFAQRSRFAKTKASALLVQRVYRGSVVRMEMARLNAKAVRLQSWWRRLAAMWDYAADRKDIVVAQSVWRMAIQIKTYEAKRKGAAAAQRLWRGMVGRRTAKMTRRRAAAAIVIQSAARKWAAVREYAADLARVVMLQAWARGLAGRRAGEQIREALREAKKERCAGEIQRWYRGSREARVYARTRRAVRLLQAYWRGHVERKALWASCKLLAKKAKEMRARIDEARRTVQEHMKLGNRTTAGLDVLLHSSSITIIIKAAASLEVTTRWSETCARCVADLGAIEKLYGVISSCNRSKPEVELAKMCLTTLQNFTQYPSLRAELANLPVAAQTLSAFISQNRDKDEAGVLRATTLLIYLCEDNEFACAVAAMHGTGSQPSPADHVRLALKSLKRKAPAPAAKKALPSKCVAALESLLKKIE